MVVGHREASRVEQGQEEHPLAVVNGVSMMENRELIRLDVSRLQWPENDVRGGSGAASSAVQEILYAWVRTSGLEYKQGMHEVCLAVYLECGGEARDSDAMFSEMMKWLYPLFYADGAVGEWIDAELMRFSSIGSPSASRSASRSASPRVAALLARYNGSHEVWSVRWCRLLFMRELDGAREYWPVWRAVMDADASERGRLVACVAVVLMVCVLPELCAAQDESEWLSVLLHYPGPRGLSGSEIAAWAAQMAAQMAAHMASADDNASANASANANSITELAVPPEDQLLQQTNAEWYAKYKDSDIARVRMEARLQRRVNWRLHKTGLK